MRKSLKNEAGFAVLVELVVVAIILLAISGAVYAVYKLRTSTKPQVNVESARPVAADMGTLILSVTCMHTIDPQPCATKIKIVDQNSSQSNTDRFMPTDASGHLSVDLPVGTYLLTPQPKPEYPYVAYPQSNPVKVTAQQTNNVSILYHDGTK